MLPFLVCDITCGLSYLLNCFHCLTLNFYDIYLDSRTLLLATLDYARVPMPCLEQVNDAPPLHAGKRLPSHISRTASNKLQLLELSWKGTAAASAGMSWPSVCFVKWPPPHPTPEGCAADANWIFLWGLIAQVHSHPLEWCSRRLPKI